MDVRLLNSSATLNSFVYIDSIAYSPGESIVINVQFQNTELDIRYILDDPDAIVTAEIMKTDNTNLTKTLSRISTWDGSLWTLTLDVTETLDLASSNIFFSLDINGDATIIKKVAGRGILNKILSEGDCC